MSEPLYSTFADDEDMAELVEMFVDEIPDRIEALRAASEDIEQLRMLAHQIKGSAGSYGFQIITDAGAALEQATKDGDANTVSSELEKLIALLDRATAVPDPNA